MFMSRFSWRRLFKEHEKFKTLYFLLKCLMLSYSQSLYLNHEMEGDNTVDGCLFVLNLGTRNNSVPDQNGGFSSLSQAFRFAIHLVEEQGREWEHY